MMIGFLSSWWRQWGWPVQNIRSNGRSISRVRGHDYNACRRHSNPVCTKKYADGRQKKGKRR